MIFPVKFGDGDRYFIVEFEIKSVPKLVQLQVSIFISQETLIETNLKSTSIKLRETY